MLTNPKEKELLNIEATSEADYIKYLCSIKTREKLAWNDICHLASVKYGLTYSESWYRRHYSDYVTESDNSENVSDVISKLESIKRDIQMERVKLNDERVQNRAYVRRLSREQTLLDIAKEVATTIGANKLLPNIVAPSCIQGFDREAILEISDWHYGMVCDNYWNSYNPDVAKERVAKLKERVIQIVKQHKVKKLHVMNLSDLIAGRIHLTIRLESRFDVITQVIHVSEILAEFLTDIAKVCDIEFYDCLDNHSRLEPVKSDSLDLESLARVIPWYLTQRLSAVKNIHINSNKYGDDIISYTCLGHEVAGVHGHRDHHKTCIEKLSTFTQQHFDLICTSHLHHFSADEHNDTLVIANGSLMGTDTHAKNLRLSSKASQNVIIVSKENVAECVYRIVLN